MTRTRPRKKRKRNKKQNKKQIKETEEKKRNEKKNNKRNKFQEAEEPKIKSRQTEDDEEQKDHLVRQQHRRANGPRAARAARCSLSAIHSPCRDRGMWQAHQTRPRRTRTEH